MRPSTIATALFASVLGIGACAGPARGQVDAWTEGYGAEAVDAPPFPETTVDFELAARGGPELTDAVIEAELAPYGDWYEDADYDWVWRPSGMPRRWVPYSRGRWVVAPAGGWVWRSDLPWGAIAFHYGRWVERPRLGWVWVPGTIYGPGWVAVRDTAGWVSWAPLPPGPCYYGDTFVAGIADLAWSFARWSNRRSAVRPARYRHPASSWRHRPRPRWYRADVGPRRRVVVPSRGDRIRRGRRVVVQPRPGAARVDRRHSVPPRVRRDAPEVRRDRRTPSVSRFRSDRGAQRARVRRDRTDTPRVRREPADTRRLRSDRGGRTARLRDDRASTRRVRRTTSDATRVRRPRATSSPNRVERSKPASRVRRSASPTRVQRSTKTPSLRRSTSTPRVRRSKSPSRVRRVPPPKPKRSSHRSRRRSVR
jgi:hypothetical protein